MIEEMRGSKEKGPSRRDDRLLYSKGGIYCISQTMEDNWRREDKGSDWRCDLCGG